MLRQLPYPVKRKTPNYFYNFHFNLLNKFVITLKQTNDFHYFHIALLTGPIPAARGGVVPRGGACILLHKAIVESSVSAWLRAVSVAETGTAIPKTGAVGAAASASTDAVGKIGAIPETEAVGVPAASSTSTGAVGKIGAIQETGAVGAGASAGAGAVGKIGAIPETEAVGAVSSTDAVGKIGAIPETGAVGAVSSTDAVGKIGAIQETGAVGAGADNIYRYVFKII